MPPTVRGDDEALSAGDIAYANHSEKGRKTTSDLAQLAARAIFLARPRLQRGLVVLVSVLVGTCLLAVATRWSTLPLLPIPLLCGSAYALRRIRATQDDNRLLLGWSALSLVTTLLGFWMMSVVARWLE